MQPLRVLSLALISLGLCSSPAFAELVHWNSCPVPPCNFTVIETATDATAEVEYASLIEVPIPGERSEIVLSGIVITNQGPDPITFLEEDVLDAQGLPTGELYGAFSIAGKPILTTWNPERLERLRKRIESLTHRLEGRVNYKRIAKLERKYAKVEARKNAKLEKLEKQIEAARRQAEDDDDKDKKSRQYEKSIKHLEKKYAKVEKRFNARLKKLKKLIDAAKTPAVAKNSRKYKHLERGLARLKEMLASIEQELQAGDPQALLKRTDTVIDASPSGSVVFNDKGFGGTLPYNFKHTGQTWFSGFSFPNGQGEITLELSFFHSLEDGTHMEDTVHTVPIKIRFQ